LAIGRGKLRSHRWRLWRSLPGQPPKGFEVMRALRKGQAQAWCLQPGIMGEVRLVERAFGIGPSALTETMIMLNKHFANAA
jgi:hypothetical protein